MDKLEQQEIDLIVISATVSVYLDEILNRPRDYQTVASAGLWRTQGSPQKKSWKWSLHPHFSTSWKNTQIKSGWLRSDRNELLK